MAKNINHEENVQAVLGSGVCFYWVETRAHARSILLAAQEKTGIPYWANGEPNVSIDCVIGQLRDGWHLESVQPSSDDDWADLACDVMDLLGDEEFLRAGTHSKPVNRTCGATASGSPIGFIVRHTTDRGEPVH
jgi:hypothetical protein